MAYDDWDHEIIWVRFATIAGLTLSTGVAILGLGVIGLGCKWIYEEFAGKHKEEDKKTEQVETKQIVSLEDEISFRFQGITIVRNALFEKSEELKMETNSRLINKKTPASILTIKI